MVCSCGVVSKGCYVHATWRACILGWILGSSESAVFPLSGCGQFGRMLVAMSTGDQSSHWWIFKISKCDPYREKFLLTERDSLQSRSEWQLDFVSTHKSIMRSHDVASLYNYTFLCAWRVDSKSMQPRSYKVDLCQNRLLKVYCSSLTNHFLPKHYL